MQCAGVKVCGWLHRNAQLRGEVAEVGTPKPQNPMVRNIFDKRDLLRKKASFDLRDVVAGAKLLNYNYKIDLDNQHTIKMKLRLFSIALLQCVLFNMSEAVPLHSLGETEGEADTKTDIAAETDLDVLVDADIEAVADIDAVAAAKLHAATMIKN